MPAPLSNDSPIENNAPTFPDLNEAPILRALASRHADPDARELFNKSALLVAPLPNGTFAICDRSQNFYILVPTFPSAEQFTQFYQLLNTSRMNTADWFYGEPNDRELANDIRAANTAPKPRPAPASLENLL